MIPIAPAATSSTRLFHSLTAVLAFAATSFGQTWQLDSSFGVAGLVTETFSRFGTDGKSYARALAVALQPDGRIAVGGHIFDEALLARFNADGALDPSFGTNGFVLSSAITDIDLLAIQPDGKMVVVGSEPTEGPSTSALARYLPDGSLDMTFGPGGVVTRSINARALALQSDGRIVLAGSVRSGNPPGNDEWALARYNPDGSPDSQFGVQGLITTRFASRGSAGAFGVVVQPDGKIIAAGTVVEDFGAGDFALARYNPDGSLDASFGHGGLVTTDFGGRPASVTEPYTSSDYASAILLQPDGKIVVIGHSQAFEGGIALARYRSDGTLDAGFGAQGLVKATRPAGFYTTAAAIQPDGGILLGGEARETGREEQHFGIARFNANGSLDESFGAGGLVTTYFPGSGYSHPRAMLVQPDGKILLAGHLDDEILALARYFGDGSRGPTFSSSGLVNSASFATGAISPDLWVDLYGLNLADQFLLDGSLPEALDGTTAIVADSEGTARRARLHFVSPDRIQFVVPRGLAFGPGSLRVSTASGAASAVGIEIAEVAPGLFSANASGQGPAAATFLRVRFGGGRSEGFTFTLDPPPNRANVPIDLGPEGDQIYLSFFGTGFRLQTSSTVRIGGIPVPVVGAVAQGQFEGLDQLVVGPLPRALAGMRDAVVEFVANGKVANVVTISVF